MCFGYLLSGGHRGVFGMGGWVARKAKGGWHSLVELLLVPLNRSSIVSIGFHRSLREGWTPANSPSAEPVARDEPVSATCSPCRSSAPACRGDGKQGWVNARERAVQR